LKVLNLLSGQLLPAIYVTAIAFTRKLLNRMWRSGRY
jgi:hypothetical protein